MKITLTLCAPFTLDRPNHLHIHFVFWEKDAKYKNGDGSYSFRKKRKIKQSAIDNMFVSMGLAIDDDKDKSYLEPIHGSNSKYTLSACVATLNMPINRT